jgi:putative adhesin
VTAPARPTPRLLVALAVVFVLLVAGTGALSLVARGFRSSTDYSRTLTPLAERLSVHNLKGAVLLLPSTDDLVHVFAQSQHGLSDPQLSAESTPSGVVLDARCDSDLAIECAVDYTVQVPPSFQVRVETGSGEVTASNLTGGMSVQVGSGDVRLDDLAGPLDVHSRSGRVEAHGLRSDAVTVDAEYGDVEAELAGVPTEVRVRSQHGDVDVAVPGSERYRLDVGTPDGSTEVGVMIDATSSHLVTATSSSGDVRVRPSVQGPWRFPVPPDAPRPPEIPVPPDVPRPPGS